MVLEAILFIVIPVAGLLVELYLFDHGLLWHREEKRDPRNFGPRR
jgi:hypothetical protein